MSLRTSLVVSQFATVAVTFCTVLMMAQTSSSIKKPFVDDGVVVQTKYGIKGMIPMPGYSYFSNDSKVYLATSNCSNNHQISEVPTRITTTVFKFNVRPNPVYIAVYKNGLRLMPNEYRLIYVEDGQLPPQFEVMNATDTDKILVDYVTGSTSVNP